MVSSTVRTRYAPSPTGFMHVGNLRTALYEYLVAKSLGGTFVLRIEDTDQKRKVAGAVEVIYRTLQQVGIRHDEGPDVGGPYAPYIQSQRLDLYRRHAEALVAAGKAYYCFCSKDKSDGAPDEDDSGESAAFAGHYNRRCRDLPDSEVRRLIAEGEPHAIRQKMPLAGKTVFQDAVYGEIAIDHEELEDQVLLKSDGFPTYNFANVVDDHEMAITHVVRGSEFLTSTPKYNLLYEAFGWDIPTYVHLPLILGKDGHKLSKRHGSTSFEELVAEGYMPQAIINYIALLGWSPADTREVFDLDELAGAFSISGISKSPSIFDYDKLTWFNSEYIRAMQPAAFLTLIRPQLDGIFGGRPYDGALLAEMLQPRVTRLTQVAAMVRFLAERQDYNLDLFNNKKSKADLDIARRVLPVAAECLKNLAGWTRESIHDALLLLASELGLKTGQLMWPVRIAVSGQEVTPGGAIEILAALGRDEALQRLNVALIRLQPVEPANFIEEFITEDIAPGGRFAGMTVHTRFPPEPNGRMHIGHLKAIVIDFGTAEKFGGLCNLRMDDTNPSKEEVEYVEAIQEDIRWMGFDWGNRFYFASDYFPRMYDLACDLIRQGLAFVCELTADQIRETRGTLTTPATPSPWRNRPIEESLDLFSRMKAGEFADGAMTLRAKIDLTSGNFNMRDPVIYRIMHTSHHRTGNAWCIYPMYDYAHPIEDALEEITHSLCSLEFEDHRPLYDWVIDHLDLPAKPRQIEFSRLGIDHTVMSKRKLRLLVESGRVADWDDPRMPTLSGMRRRGFTPSAIRSFIERTGVSKVNSTADFAFLEHCLREELNVAARRVMGVLHPVRLVIDNYPASQSELFDVENNPERPEDGCRPVSLSRKLWIEADDFQENPVKGYFRLFPGNEVRLKTAYVIRCTGCVKDADGRVTEVHADYDPTTRGGTTPDGRKIKGTIHWVDAQTALDAEVRLYDNLFTVADPDSADRDFLEYINPNSLEVLQGCKIEASLDGTAAPAAFQFLRLGYFCLDYVDSKPNALVFNRSVSLKDSYKPQG